MKIASETENTLHLTAIPVMPRVLAGSALLLSLACLAHTSVSAHPLLIAPLLAIAFYCIWHIVARTPRIDLVLDARNRTVTLKNSPILGQTSRARRGLHLMRDAVIERCQRTDAAAQPTGPKAFRLALLFDGPACPDRLVVTDKIISARTGKKLARRINRWTRAALDSRPTPV